MKKSNQSNILAYELAKQQKEISVATFFERNRHLLGFDNPRKALLTTIKEAVDNSLDATEEARVLPEITVKVDNLNDNRFLVIVEDNGPGIIKKQIPNIFAKLLYGSKFHRLKQQRGVQGIGISAAVLYGQLTTGKPARITSKISPRKPANYYELHIDTQKNEPEIVIEKEVEWKKDHGTKIEIELEGDYQRGKRSIDEYIKQTAIVNPHITLTYINPDKQKLVFTRATKELPRSSKEIKPHPYGIELGILIRMLRTTESRTLQSFLTSDFSRVGNKTAKKICEKAGLYSNTKPSKLNREEAEKLLKVIRETRLISPPTNCLSPIGEDLLEKGLKKEVDAEFYASTTRPPSVYRGNPFVIECAIAYGGSIEKEKQIKLLRFANRVPLLYQKSACAITKSVSATNWRPYGLQQSEGSLPSGPIILVAHIASVWVPFTSESKEAIAHYPETIKELKLALQEVGRKLGSHIRKTVKARGRREKINLFENYIPELATSLSKLTKYKKEPLIKKLNSTLKKGVPDLELKNGEKG